jgi:hypothetical protein
MVIGVLIVVLLMLSKHAPFMGLNAGFIALCCNFAVVGAVNLLAPVARGEIVEQLPASIGA